MRERFGVVAASAAVGGAALCAVLGPIQSWIWNGPASPAWVAQFAHLAGLSEAAPASIVEPSGESDYFRFGRLFFLTYLGAGLGAWHFERFDLRPGGPWLTFRTLQLGLAIALLGDLVAYWGGGWFGPGVRFVGFWLLEVPALLLVLLAMSAFGIALLRSLPPRRRAGWLLVAVGPSAALTTAALRYMPHGPMLPINLACAILSIACLHTRREGDTP